MAISRQTFRAIISSSWNCIILMSESSTALPSVQSKAAGLRLISLLDEIGRAESDRLREYLIRGITRAIWRDHPDAVSIRAIFGRSRLPTIDEFEHGKRESYEFLFAYDFNRENNRADSKNP